VKGTLYIVSTPIGNLEDITLRALRILNEVDCIAAEDTRHSIKLLNHYGISKPMISYWGEKERSGAQRITRILHRGKSVALISDAGTPGISDPGSVLIQKAIQENYAVVSIPGPSAFAAALSVSGLPTDEFVFLGFLPAKKMQRIKVLKELSLEPKTLIFYEAPHRLLKTLHDIDEIFPGRNISLVKELTKIHEEILRGSISDVIRHLKKRKILGEYVLIIEGNTSKGTSSVDDLLSELQLLMKRGLGRKEAVKKVAQAHGFSKKELYDKSLNEIP
jgi:16S rRNA (cytidine1402-2'-O)-methyltransferase